MTILFYPYLNLNPFCQISESINMSNDLNAIISFLNNQNQRLVNLEHNLNKQSLHMNLIKNKSQSFSQYSQDLFVLSMLNHKKNGYFIRDFNKNFDLIKAFKWSLKSKRVTVRAITKNNFGEKFLIQKFFKAHRAYQFKKS